MSNSVAASIAVRHFGKVLVRALAKRGVQIIGLTTIPDMSKPLPFAAGETGYIVDDNGTSRVLTYFDITRGRV